MKTFYGVFFALLAFTVSGHSSYNVSNNNENSAKAAQSPYILLVSIDGFRWDYIEKYRPKFLSRWVKHTARLESLRPVFPTKTFPNHLSIITGSYPQRHGILANQFYAPDLKQHYSLSKSAAVLNPDFYLVKPLWVIAEEQGMRTASYFWPGSEAAIAGKTPTYYMNYDTSKTHQDRIDTVIQWYNLPSNRRPHLTTMYFHDIDAAGHDFGQDSPQLIEAINKVDKSFENLIYKLSQLPIDVNVVLVSDHGMAQSSEENFEALPSWLENNYYTVGAGPIVHIYDLKNSSTTLAKTVEALNRNAQHFTCYQYQDLPSRLNSSSNNRIGDIACLAKSGWNIGFDSRQPIGNHGWDQFESRDMDGVFFAQGKLFKPGFIQPTAEIFMLCHYWLRCLA